MKFKSFLLTLCLVSTFVCLFGQETGTLPNLLKKLEVFTDKYPQEKVHLHLDKPYYAIGDDIWFKAYVIDAKATLPTTISDMLYVELIGEDDAVKSQLRLLLQNGTAWGDFKLPDTLFEGNYRIRAYTQWMRNAGPQFFFDKTIQVGNNWTNQVYTKTKFSLLQDPAGNRTRAEILLTDSLHQPIADTQVTYQIRLAPKTIIKGTGKTNGAGKLSLAFPSSITQNELGQISLNFAMNNGKKIVKHIPIKPLSPTLDVQFFPEGGHMVNGIPLKIAIKSINSNGLGQNVNGIIVDNEDQQVTKFETSYLGMGTFLLNPSANKTYTAKIKMDNGTELLVPLPKAENSGYGMMVYDLDTATIGVKILISNDLLNKGTLNFVSHRNGKPYTVASIPTTDKASLIALQRKELPSGILQLTLFSPTNLPVCERLVFINNANDTVQLQLQKLNKAYTTRQMVDLTLLSNVDKPVWADFSVSVTNASAVAPDPENESNILTTLLLTSDLTGYVEKPNHYFLKNDNKTRNELDLLLLTQGWRKINWQQVLDPKAPLTSYPAEKGLTISGTVSANGGNPMANSKITLLSKTNGLSALDTLTDEKGRFIFKNLSFKENTKFLLQVKIKKEKNVRIQLDSLSQQPVTAIHNLGDIEINVNEKLEPYLIANSAYQNDLTKRGLLNRSIALKEVNIVGQRPTAAKNSSNLNGPGNADYVFDVSNLTSGTSLDIYLQGRVPSVAFRSGIPISMRKAGNLSDPIKDKNGATRVKQDPMEIVLDGLFMGPDYNLRSIDPDNIESIEVLLSLGKLAIYGSRGANGLILITTKRGKTKVVAKEEAPGVISFLPTGFDVPREFYAPKYDVEKNNTPDLRNTIYWNPDLKVDEKGVVKFSYYNSDQKGTYRIVLEGIDAFGNLARKVYTYQVN